MASSLGIQMGTIALSVCAVAAQSAAAYVYPLSEESVREAYFLGRSTDGEKLAKFLGQYVRHFPYPINGPYVGEIEFRTPYEQVVLRSWQNSMGYSAQQAQKDYAAQPDSVVVRVVIYLTPTYAGTSKDFWREFPIRVVQGQTIEPKKVSSRPLYRRRGGLGGAEVLLELDAAQVESGTVRIEVTKPDGKIVQAEFNLNKLK